MTYAEGTVIEAVKDWPDGMLFKAGERFVMLPDGRWTCINSEFVLGSFFIPRHYDESLFVEVEDNRKWAALASRPDVFARDGMILTVTHKDGRETVFRDVRVDSISIDGDTLTFEGTDFRNTPVTHVLSVSHYTTISE